MTPTPTQVRERVRFLVECAVKGDNLDVTVGEIMQAVRLDLFTECERCGGTGDSERLLYNQDGVPQFHTDGTELYELCGTCGSVGVTSCQSFPCEHGGHTCTACGGSGLAADTGKEQ